MNIHFLQYNEFHMLKSFQKESINLSDEITNLFIDDYIVFINDKKIIGIVKVIAIYDNFLQIQFISIYEEELKPLFVGKIRDILVSNLGDDFLNSTDTFQLNGASAEIFLNEIQNMPDSFGYYITNIDWILEEKEKEEKIRLEKEIKLVRRTVKTQLDLSALSEHAKAQYYLKEIAKIVQCDVWMASNDQNREIYGTKLGDFCIEDLPPFEMEEDAKKTIGYIDTIWFKGHSPLCAFEVEKSTSIYSGLLRMADLISTIPNKEIRLFIVAPLSRKEKVMKELNRPIFKAIGMKDYCKYIPMESLELFYQKIKGLDGFLSYQSIDLIAQSYKDTEILI